MNNITSILEACVFLGLNAEEEIPFKEPKNGHQIAVNSWAYTIIVIEAINADEDGTLWVPDFDNWEERKYTAWWDMRSEAAGGSGLSCGAYDGDYDVSYVGARLVFRDRPRAEQFAKYFTDLAKGWMVIEKSA